jgi:hypothetical protein
VVAVLTGIGGGGGGGGTFLALILPPLAGVEETDLLFSASLWEYLLPLLSVGAILLEGLSVLTVHVLTLRVGVGLHNVRLEFISLLLALQI